MMCARESQVATNGASYLALPTPSLSPVQAPKRSEFISFSYVCSPVEFPGKVRCLSPVLLPTSPFYASYSSRIPVLGAFIRV